MRSTATVPHPLTPWLAPPLAVAGALLFLAAGPPFELSGAAWLCFVPLLVALRRASPTGAAVAGALFGAVVAAGVFYGVALHDRVLAAVVVALGASVLATFALLARVMVHDPRAGLRVLGPPVVWAAVELVCTSSPIDLPVTPGAVLAGSPAFALAPWIGGLGLSCLLVLAGALGAETLEGGPQRVRAACALLAGVVALGAGAALPRTAAGPPPGRPIAFRAIQPAIPFDRSSESWWRPDLRRGIRERFAREVRAASRSRASLVLWPEGGGMLSAFAPTATREWLPQLGSGERTWLVSNSDFDPTRGSRRNRVLAFDAREGWAQSYQKRRLVPWAERLYEAGVDAPLLATRAGPAGALICFEVCFPDAARELVAEGAQWLFVSTNDASFGDTPLPLWHRLAARLRAAETATPVLFVSNRGPSAHIDARGRVVESLALGRAGVLEGALRPREEPPSFYARCGRLLGAVLALLGLAALAAAWRGRARRSPAVEPASCRRTVAGALLGLAVAAAGLGALGVAGHALLGAGDAPAFAGTDTQAGLSDFRQRSVNTCGVAALAYVASTLGEPVAQARLEPLVALRPEGASLLALRDAARALGLVASGHLWSYARLMASPLPVIVHLSDVHYVVVLAARRDRLLLFDPNAGLIVRDRDDFTREWTGYVLEVLPRAAPITKTASPGPGPGSQAGGGIP